MQPHEAALHAAQAAQSAAIDARDQLREVRELEDARNDPALLTRLTFTSTITVHEWRNHVDRPTRSFGILNPTGTIIYCGLGGGTASLAAGAVGIPSNSLLVLPVGIDALEVGIDPGDVAAAFATATALTVYGFRFSTVQPAFLGSVT